MPVDGSLPDSALAEVAGIPLAVYLHVPFCAARCGYCDFNTYVPGSAGLGGTGFEDFLTAAHREIDLAGRVLAQAPAASSVFFGGGTPTLLPASDLVDLLDHVRDTFGLTPDAEVTTEANPESVDLDYLGRLVDGGFTRISLGMQSAVPGVLARLDRRHTPGRALQAAVWAHQAGFAEVNLDLIYGTPGETLEDWRESVQAALSVGPEHLSAYALVVEPGTALGRKVARGELGAPDDDDQADKYLLADDLLSGAGFANYEISNWARGVEHRARHNLAYWRGYNWWGIGPGAHSHVGGVRWWNVRQPRSYAQRLAQGVSPGAGREVLDAETRRFERVLLELRLADGLPTSVLSPAETRRVPGLVGRGLVDQQDGRLVLTRNGRLLADAVVRDLTA